MADQTSPETTPSSVSPPQKGPKWLRKYPPLAFLVIAIFIAAVILPSSLNLPQARPSTVLEYAPVPPEDDSPPPNDGSISSLGLGTSSSLADNIDTPDVVKKGKGERPITKRCVGNPPRQTEDPNAPPCVPFFEGDNGGATWQGITGDEIVVLIYTTTFISADPSGENEPEATPAAGQYCDVDGPPDSDPACLARAGNGVYTTRDYDHGTVRVTRALSRYFNERFQTYGRHVHFYIYWSGGRDASSRRADAADNWQTLKPFAVLDQIIFGGFNDVYAEAMVKRHVMVFGEFPMRAASYFRQYAPMIWGFWPDTEHAVDMYVSYVCKKIAGNPVRFSGNGDIGQPRKYALMRTTDRIFSGLHYYADLAEQGLKQCIPEKDIVARVSFSRNQYAVDTHSNATTEAQLNVAEMRQNEVTTILWTGGYETQHSKEATRVGWLPEWVVAGDRMQDSISHTRYQDQDAWRHAVAISNFLRTPEEGADVPCRQAYREAEPRGTNTDRDEACSRYHSFFTLFRGIQAAGPFLQPETVNEGHHAFPKIASTSPYVAACFYDPGDFTCVKDANEQWWDPDAPDPDGDPDAQGCYRLVREGKRYLAGTWEGTDGDPFSNPNDPCNNVGSDTAIHPYGNAQE